MRRSRDRPGNERAQNERRSPAAGGVGPLLQRDYWAVVEACELSPAEIGAVLASRFEEIPPPQLARFERVGRGEGPLQPGDVLDVHIRLAGTFRVRVLHRNANSLTVGTLIGHPEAGRITFGAYRHRAGDVLLHIRSRARSSSPARRAGFLALGEAMQTNTWTDFINRLAATVGRGVKGRVHVETSRVADEDASAVTRPTYLAEGS